MTVTSTTKLRPGKGWPREVAPHDLDHYGIRVTSVVAPVPDAAPQQLSALARSCWQVLHGMERPMGVLELAARVGHPPITTVLPRHARSTAATKVWLRGQRAMPLRLRLRQVGRAFPRGAETDTLMERITEFVRTS